jgi:acyl dehydratase
MKFFEDIHAGEVTDLGRHTFTADDIKAFAARFDPQPFHLDETAAARTHFGKLCASGWQTVCVWMRLLIECRGREDAERRARGEDAARLGPSPGFQDLQWLRPVHAGDTISYATEIVATRMSNSRPGWGMVTARNTGVNQRGEPVLAFVSSVLVECRRSGKPPS